METATLTQFDDFMQNRYQVYSVIASLFRTEVTDEMLQIMQRDGFMTYDGFKLGDGLELMNDYLQSPEASTLDLARDFAKTFCGASSTKKTSAYPFESIYTSEAGILMQEARDDVVRWYLRYDLSKSKQWLDCEDHLAVELEFMLHLMSRYQNAVAADDCDTALELLSAQYEFATKHLVNWVPLFEKHVELHARTEFYRGLGRFTEAYLQTDHRYLGEVLYDITGRKTGVA